MEKADILGIHFDNVTLESATQRIMERIRKGEKGYVVTPNSEIAYLCKDDPSLQDLINEAALVIPDGIGIVYAAKILNEKLSGKVAGIDFASSLMAAMAKEGRSLYLFGAKPGVAQTAAKNLQEKYPGLVIQGYRDGYFKKDEEALDSIRQAGHADVVFVCLGAPKQERFMRDHLAEMDATVLCGLGGSLDVFAGIAERAPDIWIKLGLEWLYRLCKEPQRIGRMMSLPKFMMTVMKSKVKGKGE